MVLIPVRNFNVYNLLLNTGYVGASKGFSHSMFLDLATQEEIIDTTCKFPVGKSAGYDNIPMAIIK